MKYKGSPSDPFWKGSDDDTYRDSEGLVILRSYPVGVPSIVPPQPLQVGATAIKHFGHQTGIMPTRGLIPDDSVTEKERGWGTVELVGAKNRT